MQKQLFQVWISYWIQTQSAWHFLLLILTILFLYYTVSPDHSRLRQLAPTLTQYDSSDFISLDFRYSSTSPPLPSVNDTALHFHNLAPHAKSLSIDIHSINQLDLNQIHTLTQLEQLTLIANTIPANFLTTIAPELSELKIESQLLLQHPEELKALGKLRLLITDNLNLTDDFFQLVATIPNLKYFVITDHRDLVTKSTPSRRTIDSINIPAKPLEPLLSHPKISGVFANWSPDSTLTKQFTLLFPYYYDAYHLATTCFAWLPILTCFSLITNHTRTLFQRPQAHLIPNFSSHHYAVAALIFLFTLTLCVFALHIDGIYPLAAITYCLLPVSLVSLINLFTYSLSINSRYLSYQLVYFFSLFIENRIPTNIVGLYEKSLEGQLTLYVLIALLTQSVLIVWTFRHLTQRALFASESTTSQHILDFLKRFTPSTSKPLHHNYIPGFWQQVLLWRAGNSQRAFAYIMIVLAIPIAVEVLGHSDSYNLKSFFGMFPLYIIMLMVLASRFWETRVKTFEIESLRPRSRQQLARQILTAAGIDHLLILILPMAVYFIALLLPSSIQHDDNMPQPIPILLTTFIYLFTFGASALCWPRQFTSTTFLIFATPISITIYNFLPASVTQTQRTTLSLAILAATVPISATILLSAYKNTLNHEWGRSK